MTTIKFGTSGWRGIIADELTFHNVRVVSRAISDYVREEGLREKGIIVGRDCRFLGDRFARQAAETLAGNGVKVLFSPVDVPTPVISYAIIRGRAAGAINITASHNPPEYSGIKFSPAWGGPAEPEVTTRIAKRANDILKKSETIELLDESGAKEKGLWEEINLKDDYLAGLSERVDFDAIKNSGVKTAFDALYGSGLGYVDQALDDHGIGYEILHDWHDPSFGGSAPDPSEANLSKLSKLVRSDSHIALGISTDGDADRFGVVDGDGTFIEPNYIIALLLDYLIAQRDFPGGVARSVATTHLIDAVAKHHDVPCYETPVGFKYIGSYIAEDKIVGGGEESAGFTIRGHVPEKDGIITCLLALEMVAKTGRSIQELLEDLYQRVGEYHTKRINLTLTRELEEAFPEKMERPPGEFAGVPVAEIITIDGNKFVLEDGSWILLRKSGTEPVVRIYAEAPDEPRLEKVVDAARAFIES